MTEQEAIKELKEYAECSWGDLNESFDMAIKALETQAEMWEILEALKEYSEIGTVEEFKSLKEKDTPYKPEEYGDRYYGCKCGNILLPKWLKYPTELMPKSEGLPHCLACGQKLDWE